MSKTRWRCLECDSISDASALLRAPSPFDPDDELVGCPTCKAVNAFQDVCDEPGCVKDAGCGWPTPDGRYRRTCFQHSSFAKEHA